MALASTPAGSRARRVGIGGAHGADGYLGWRRTGYRCPPAWKMCRLLGSSPKFMTSPNLASASLKPGGQHKPVFPNTTSARWGWGMDGKSPAVEWGARGALAGWLCAPGLPEPHLITSTLTAGEDRRGSDQDGGADGNDCSPGVSPWRLPAHRASPRACPRVSPRVSPLRPRAVSGAQMLPLTVSIFLRGSLKPRNEKPRAQVPTAGPQRHESAGLVSIPRAFLPDLSPRC